MLLQSSPISEYVNPDTLTQPSDGAGHRQRLAGLLKCFGRYGLRITAARPVFLRMCAEAFRMQNHVPGNVFSNGRVANRDSGFQDLDVTSLTRAQFLRGDWQQRAEPPPESAVPRIEAACIARQGVFCRSCGERCDPGAIRFRPMIGRPPIPEIDAAACTGCGACVDVCPTHAVSLAAFQPRENC